MLSTCILTDGTVQFTQPGFAGRELVRVFPFEIQHHDEIFTDGEGMKSNSLPSSAFASQPPRLLDADLQKCIQVFQSLAGQYREILVILTSCHLSPIFGIAEKAAQAVRGQAMVTLIDSQTTSIGLGLLVQYAAEAASHGLPRSEIDRIIRKMVSQVYSLFSPSGLSYLQKAGFIDEGQALVGELLGLLPIFSLEEGRLSPIEKARNQRAVMDFFQEFLGEFDNLMHIAILQGPSPYNHETHLLREHAQIHFPRTPFSEHTINLPVATLFGPRTFGLILLEGT